MQCSARCKTNIFKQCTNKTNGVKYCLKHKNNTDDYNISLFNVNETNTFIQEYINNTLKSKNNFIIMKYILYIYNYHFTVDLKKKEVSHLFKDFIQKYKYYFNNINKIIKLQSYFRKNYTNYINRLKGPGLFNRSICINDNDFYSFEPKNTIEFNNFFSYKDIDNNVYCFDIRSFESLIKNNSIFNPYNRNTISTNVLHNFKLIITYLQNNNLYKDYEKDILTPEQEFIQKVIYIFQKIDKHNYNTDIHWFTKLPFIKLKNFWYELEDIWNFRANLSSQEKNNIVCINKKQPFTLIKNTNYYIPSRIKLLQNVILDDINILVSSGIDNASQNLGCIYVLIALSKVSFKCLENMPWLQYANI